MNEYYNILLYRLMNLNGFRQYISFDSIALAFYDPETHGDFKEFKVKQRMAILERFSKVCKKYNTTSQEYLNPPHKGDFCIRKNESAKSMAI